MEAPQQPRVPKVSVGIIRSPLDGGNGAYSDVTLFDVSSDGELTMFLTRKITGSINGAAIIRYHHHPKHRDWRIS
jgi:hypothetical protein